MIRRHLAAWERIEKLCGASDVCVTRERRHIIRLCQNWHSRIMWEDQVTRMAKSMFGRNYSTVHASIAGFKLETSRARMNFSDGGQETFRVKTSLILRGPRSNAAAT